MFLIKEMLPNCPNLKKAQLAKEFCLSSFETMYDSIIGGYGVLYKLRYSARA